MRFPYVELNRPADESSAPFQSGTLQATKSYAAQWDRNRYGGEIIEEG